MGVKAKVKGTYSVKYQYLTALVANLLSIVFGLAEGWTSPCTEELRTSDAMPLKTGKITMDEASWMTALLHLGAFFGAILFGFIINHFGRKLPLLLIAIPIIISWLLIWFAENVYYFYAGRMICGLFGGSGYMIVPIFLSEIAHDKHRGALISTLVLSEMTGILLSSIIGNYFGCYVIPVVAIGITVLFAISFLFLPESPTFLIKHHKVNEAEKSLRFYYNLRQTDEDAKIVDSKIRALSFILGDTNNRNRFEWSDVTTGVGRKALLIGIVLVGLTVFSGVFAMTSYTAFIFGETGSSLSPNESAIIVGAIQLLGSFVATQLVDRWGRKILLIISCIGSAFGLIVLGVYKIWHETSDNAHADPMVNWIPVASFSWSIFVTTLGILPLSLIVIAEIMPEKVRDACISFCITLLWIFAFINVKYLPTFIDILGFHWTMFMFAGVSVFGALFIIFIVPETKRKNRVEILKSLQ